MRDQWIEWLQDNHRRFFYGVTLVVASFFLAFQVFAKYHKTARSKPPAVLQETFENWLVQGEAFEKLEEALKRTPELETRLGAMIADKFIVQNDGQRAEPFAEGVLRRVLRQTPEHAMFAHGSLLIAKGELENALTEALSLKEQLDQSTLLYGFNLVRIASLSRALECFAAEQTVLEELETFMQAHQSAASILMECFHEGTTTLVDYIHERKTHANSK